MQELYCWEKLDASHSQGLKGEGRDFHPSKAKYINIIYP